MSDIILKILICLNLNKCFDDLILVLNQIMSSSLYIPPLTILRDALVRRLHKLKETSGVLTPVDVPRVDALISALHSTDPTCSSLVAAASMVPNQSCGFEPLSPLKSSNPLDYTCFQFGQGNLGWHFCYGNFGTVAFTLMFFRVEMGTPCILKEMDIAPEAGVIYTISAGFGNRGGPWTTLPPTAVQGIYKCGNQSFSFQAISDSGCPWLQNFTMSQDQGLTKIDLAWKNSDQLVVGYNVTLTPSKPPLFQGPKGCLPCAGGQGTIYWSYPLMTAEGQVGPVSSGNILTEGVGWYDHQWLSAGGALNSKLLQLFSNVQGMFKTPVPIRWLWITLQLPGDVQYMTSTILSELPKLGKTYNFTVITKNSGSSISYDAKGTITIDEMVQVGQQSYPTKYSIILEGKSYILQASFGNAVVYLPSGVLNWEGPGSVYDTNGNLIGGGFLEANQLDTAENLISTIGKRAGVQSSDFNLFKLKKTSICAGLWSAMFLILGLIFILMILIIGIKEGYKFTAHRS